MKFSHTMKGVMVMATFILSGAIIWSMVKSISVVSPSIQIDLPIENKHSNNTKVNSSDNNSELPKLNRRYQIIQEYIGEDNTLGQAKGKNETSSEKLQEYIKLSLEVDSDRL